MPVTKLFLTCADKCRLLSGFQVFRVEGLLGLENLQRALCTGEMLRQGFRASLVQHRGFLTFGEPHLRVFVLTILLFTETATRI